MLLLSAFCVKCFLVFIGASRSILVFTVVLINGTIITMKRKHERTLTLIFSRPVSGNIKWSDIEALFIELGTEISEREGSRIGVKLFGECRVFHRPHPQPTTDKGAVASVHKWLNDNEVSP